MLGGYIPTPELRHRIPVRRRRRRRWRYRILLRKGSIFEDFRFRFEFFNNSTRDTTNLLSRSLQLRNSNFLPPHCPNLPGFPQGLIKITNQFVSKETVGESHDDAGEGPEDVMQLMQCQCQWEIPLVENESDGCCENVEEQ